LAWRCASWEIQHFSGPVFSEKRREIVEAFLEMGTAFQQIFGGNKIKFVFGF